MKICMSLACFFFLFFSERDNLVAQTIARDVVGSAGTYVSTESGSMAWTIGEVTIDTYANANHFLTQGFHQPDTKTDLLVTEFFIPEGFSPNGDGINDLFVIRGIDMYPNNSIDIFNRWGNIVFKAHPYQNTWDGTTTMGVNVGGDELPIGTYFYLFDFGNTSKIIKGTIYLNR